MPTYKYLGRGGHIVFNANNEMITLQKFGETFESFDSSLRDRPEYELISEDPYWNPVIRIDRPTGTTATIEIDPDCRSMHIANFSATASVDVYLNSTSNTPPITIPSQQNISLDYANFSSKVYKLEIEFSATVNEGEVIIQQYRNRS